MILTGLLFVCRCIWPDVYTFNHIGQMHIHLGISLHSHCKSLVHPAGNKSHLFLVGVGLCQGCTLSQSLSIIFIDRIPYYVHLLALDSNQKNGIQAVEISFLCREADLSFILKESIFKEACWGGLTIWQGCHLGEVFWAFHTGKRLLGKIHDTMERFHLTAGLGIPRCSPG